MSVCHAFSNLAWIRFQFRLWWITLGIRFKRLWTLIWRKPLTVHFFTSMPVFILSSSLNLFPSPTLLFQVKAASTKNSSKCTSNLPSSLRPLLSLYVDLLLPLCQHVALMASKIILTLLYISVHLSPATLWENFRMVALFQSKLCIFKT